MKSVKDEHRISIGICKVLEIGIQKKYKLLSYPTSVVEGVGDEFISVRESLIS